MPGEGDQGIQDRNRPSLHGHEASLAKIAESGADRFAAAADQIRDLLLGKSDPQANPAPIRYPVRSGQLQQKMGKPGGDITKDEILDSALNFPEPQPHPLVEL